MLKFYFFVKMMILAKWSPRTPKIHCVRGYFSHWGVRSVKYAKFQYFIIFLILVKMMIMIHFQ